MQVHIFSDMFLCLFFAICHYIKKHELCISTSKHRSIFMEWHKIFTCMSRCVFMSVCVQVCQCEPFLNKLSLFCIDGQYIHPWPLYSFLQQQYKKKKERTRLIKQTKTLYNKYRQALAILHQQACCCSPSFSLSRVCSVLWQHKMCSCRFQPSWPPGSRGWTWGHCERGRKMASCIKWNFLIIVETMVTCTQFPLWDF